jgi:hypothetical protein
MEGGLPVVSLNFCTLPPNTDGAPRVLHIVFIDGKEQWSHRKSDTKRFIDLFRQGIVDHLVVGREVETEWKELLRSYFPLAPWSCIPHPQRSGKHSLPRSSAPTNKALTHEVVAAFLCGSFIKKA